MKKTELRIIEVKIGIKTFYQPEIRFRWLWFIPMWIPFSVSSDGNVSYWWDMNNRYQLYEQAARVIKDYIELFGSDDVDIVSTK